MQRVTKKMLDDWMYEAGEDFIDYHTHLINGVTISAFMAGHRKRIARPLWEAMNESGRTWCIQDTLHLYSDLFTTVDDDGNCDYKGEELFYKDFVKAINTTTVSRRRVLDALAGVEDED